MNGYKHKKSERKYRGSQFLEPSFLEAPRSVDWREKGYVTPVKDQVYSMVVDSFLNAASIFIEERCCWVAWWTLVQACWIKFGLVKFSTSLELLRSPSVLIVIKLKQCLLLEHSRIMKLKLVLRLLLFSCLDWWHGNCYCIIYPT